MIFLIFFLYVFLATTTNAPQERIVNQHPNAQLDSIQEQDINYNKIYLSKMTEKERNHNYNETLTALISVYVSS